MRGLFSFAIQNLAKLERDLINSCKNLPQVSKHLHVRYQGQLFSCYPWEWGTHAVLNVAIFKF